MILKYTFSGVTDRHIASINKDLKECIARDEAGKVYEKLTLWKSDWAMLWDSIKSGYTLAGELKETEKNGYKNFILYPERTNALGPKRSPAAINQAMEKKAHNIEIAQDRKADSIKLAATARDATLLTVAMIQKNPGAETWTTDEVKDMWQEWRKWLTTEFDQQPPF